MEADDTDVDVENVNDQQSSLSEHVEHDSDDIFPE